MIHDGAVGTAGTADTSHVQDVGLVGLRQSHRQLAPATFRGMHGSPAKGHARRRLSPLGASAILAW